MRASFWISNLAIILTLSSETRATEDEEAATVYFKSEYKEYAVYMVAFYRSKDSNAIYTLS